MSWNFVKEYMSERKVYLGDGVYATRDVRGIVLTTENGLEVTNTIVLEPEVLRAFCAWAGLGAKRDDKT